MSETDVTVLNSILEQSKQVQAPDRKDDEFFEMFAAHKVLREFQVDPDDIDSGLVGTRSTNKKGSDGGLDGFYLFANGKIIRDQSDAESAKQILKKGASIDIIFLQASRQTGFSLDRLTRLKDTCEDIFALQIEPKDFSETYNEFLLDAIGRFRLLHRLLVTSYPSYQLSIFYVTKGDKATLSDTLTGTAKDIGKSVQGLLPTIKKTNFEFIGARELIELATKPPKLTHTLSCSGLITSKKLGGHVALLPLSEFLKFLRAEDGSLRTSLFESNVRDYQGAVAVNEAIENTLKEPGAEDFWWLNNGVTIIADQVGGDSRDLVLTEPQIVNGLQTSQKIYDYFSANKERETQDNRELLVRIIKAPNPQSHDQIILATNSQTSIPKASLWATSQVHRDIEAHFRSQDLYYDRRKNSWRREGKEFNKVVGITELAQSVASIFRREPNEARGSPGRYFNKQKHGTIFSDRFNINMYVVCAILKKKTVAFLRQVESEKAHINNLTFYVMTATACIALKTAFPGHNRIAGLNLAKINDNVFQEALNLVRPIYKEFGETDQAAKGSDMVEKLRAVLKLKFARKRKVPL